MRFIIDIIVVLAMTYFFLFLFGLIVGSFLNVVSLRYDPEKNVFDFRNLLGRSHCPSCGATLSWFELVPVLSFLIQRGKCMTCGKKISWQYPLVELASGFVFLLPLYFSNYTLYPLPQTLIESAVWIAVFLTFILIGTIDYRLYLIPDELNISLALLGFFRIASTTFYAQFGEFQGSFIGSYAALFGLRESVILNHLFGALIGASIVGLIILITKGRGMGMGDLKLMAALGVLFGWPDTLFLFIFGTFIGAIVSLALILFQKKNMKSQVPFGPFLIAGTLTLFFFGENLLRAYFSFFNLY